MLHSLLEWLRALPPAALSAVAAVFAAAENVFPPLPSDVVVALAAFLSGGERGSILGVLAAATAGNVAGAMFTYYLGAHYGTARVLARLGGEAQEARLRRWYARYGIAAIAVSRFLPGVRSVVPPVAGALRISALRSAVAMALPSAIWYGGITYVAFTAGSDVETLAAQVGAGQRWLALGAGALVLVAAVVWWVRRAQARRRA